MSSYSLTHADLEALCEYADIEIEDIRTDYSGRGMNGNSCIGVVVRRNDPSISLWLAIFLVMAEDGFEDVAEVPAVRAVDVMFDLTEYNDGMGLSQIQYWPQVHLREESEAADGEEEVDHGHSDYHIV
jgi:hypothetical protein